ncbi:hypothetical protein [Prescottella equi]|uniref:hypothetical protein n=1 Tax=Rhodococcus hoagii TaxID=43767 RepID=UPI000A242E0E|nr:hypothetical protein [Prescottella equi]ORL11673.1 hypothetical protein A6I85_17300 [Prescottella equi]
MFPRAFQQIQSIEDDTTRRLDVKVKKISLAFGVDRDWLMWGGPLNDVGVSEGAIVERCG